MNSDETATLCRKSYCLHIDGEFKPDKPIFVATVLFHVDIIVQVAVGRAVIVTPLHRAAWRWPRRSCRRTDSRDSRLSA